MKLSETGVPLILCRWLALGLSALGLSAPGLPGPGLPGPGLSALGLPVRETPARELSNSGIPRGPFCILWYNVENLFYPQDDTIPGDDEFTPQGVCHWTWFRYRAKITAVAKVIIAAGRGEAPGLVALCEVENARVLEDLCAHPLLSPFHYSFLHQESQDHRGMDVACLVRRERVRTLIWETARFMPPVSDTRDVMHVGLAWGGDTLDLFLVHLISKYGGAGATAVLRSMQIGQLTALMDSVYQARSRGWILTAGDFNESYEGFAMEAIRSASFGGDSLSPVRPLTARGTYKYRGRWSFIDQVLTLPSLAGGPVRVSCLSLTALLTDDLQYGGIKPKRCYEGKQYRGGISDHLPLLIDLNPSVFSGPVER